MGMPGNEQALPDTVGGWPSRLEGVLCPLERRAAMVTYMELFTLMLVIIGIVALFNQENKKK